MSDKLKKNAKNMREVVIKKKKKAEILDLDIEE